MSQQPPNVNGIMELSEAETATIRTKLSKIVAAFVPTDDQPACDTFHIVSTYNRENPSNEINGDTAEGIFH